MEIRLKQTGQVMYLDEFRRIQKENGTPYWYDINELNVTNYDVDVVLNGPYPSHTHYQTVYRDGVEQINGQWFTKFSVSDMDDAGKAAADAQQAQNVRQSRDLLLKDSDWTQGKDIQDSVSTPWATYRQALRDVPTQSGFPWSVTWPVKPE